MNTNEVLNKLLAEIDSKLLHEQGFEDGDSEYGYKCALKDIKRTITSLQQEQPELPPIGYAETYYQRGLRDGIIKGRINILRGLEDIEKRKAKPVLFIKEQEQPDNKEKIMNFFAAVGDCGFSQHDILLLKNIWKETGCQPHKSQVADASKMEHPEVDIVTEYDEQFNSDPVFRKLANRNAGIAIARHFAEWGAIHLNARKEE